jgi:uncharacterized membrane protein YhaH (DUF805 family)
MIRNFLFRGRLGRKHYFISVLVYCVVAYFILYVANEGTLTTYLLVFSILLFIKTPLDAKRLRDVYVPGKMAPIVVALFLIAYIPFTYDVASGVVGPFTPRPAFLSFMGLFFIIGQWYLYVAKGDKEETEYGKPTWHLSLKNALLSRGDHSESLNKIDATKEDHHSSSVKKPAKRIGYTLLVVVGILFALLLGIWYYNEAQKTRWACLQRIGIRGDGYYGLKREGLTSKAFETQKEAIDYCLSEVKYSEKKKKTESGTYSVVEQTGPLYEQFREMKASHNTSS